MHPTEETTFPVLTTPRLTLRRLRLNDTPVLQILRSNDEVNQYLDRPKSMGLADAIDFVEKIDANHTKKNSFYWVITLTEDDYLIGTICLWNLDTKNETADIGYELHPDFHGRGIMKEALSAVIHYGFHTLHFKTITAYTIADNLKSIKLLERAGFILKEHIPPSANELKTESIYMLNRSNHH